LHSLRLFAKNWLQASNYRKYNMRKILIAISIVSLTTLFSCGIKGHNRAELRPVNATDERIYGDIGGVARQTLNKYEDDATGKTAERISKIKAKMYPR